MKCEICHKSDAKKAIRVAVGGKEKELYVCKECADKHAERLPRRKFNHRPFDDMSDPDDDGFFDSLFRDIEGNGVDEGDSARHRHATLAEDIPPCPECGTTIEDVAETGLLGCPQCYTAFKESLMRELGLHGSFGGKLPRRGGTGGNTQGGDAQGGDEAHDAQGK